MKTVLTESKAGAEAGALHHTLSPHFQAHFARKARQGCNASEPFVRSYWHAYAIAAGFLPPLPFSDALGLFQNALDEYAQAERALALTPRESLTEDIRERARVARVCCLQLFNKQLSAKG